MQLKKQILAIATFIFLPAIHAFCGTGLTDRAEILPPNDITDFGVQPAGNNGALAYYRNATPADKKIDNWVFIKYDTLLHQAWQKTFAMDRKKEYTTFTDYNDGVFYILYHAGTGSKYNIVCVDIINNTVEEFADDLGKGIDLARFKVNNGTAYFTGDQKGHATLLGVNLKTKEKTYFATDNLGTQVYARYMLHDEKDGSIKTCFSWWDKKLLKFALKTLSKEGKLVGDIVIAADVEDKELDEPKATSLDDNSKILLGTYHDAKATASRGIYVAKYNGATQEFIKFYNFLEFKGFFTWYSGRVTEALEGRAADKKTLHMEDDLNYKLIVHQPVMRGNDIIFMGEAHYPLSAQMTETNRSLVTGPNSSMPIGDQTTNLYRGEVFSHALVACFDLKGAKLWSNSFAMDDNITPVSSIFLTPDAEMAVNGDAKNIQLVLPANDTIVAKYVVGDKVSSERSIPYKDIRQANDEIKYTGDANTTYWFGRNFIFSGHQKMKAGYSTDKKVKDLYFVNKLSYPVK